MVIVIYNGLYKLSLILEYVCFQINIYIYTWHYFTSCLFNDIALFQENRPNNYVESLSCKICTNHITVWRVTSSLCDWAYKRSRATYRKEKGIVS